MLRMPALDAGHFSEKLRYLGIGLCGRHTVIQEGSVHFGLQACQGEFAGVLRHSYDQSNLSEPLAALFVFSRMPEPGVNMPRAPSAEPCDVVINILWDHAIYLVGNFNGVPASRMLRILLVILLSLHGAIHLMGFAKAFGFAKMPALTLPIAEPMGVAWGTTAVLFLVASTVLLLGSDRWWMPAPIALVLSQVLSGPLGRCPLRHYRECAAAHRGDHGCRGLEFSQAVYRRCGAHG